MTNHNDFPGFKVSPLDILATLLADSLASEGEPAKRKEPEFDFDLKSHFDNLAAKGQEFFGGINIPGLFDERKDDKDDNGPAVPAVDVLVLPSGVRVLVGAPGVRQDDVEVLLEDTVLTISIRSNHAVENLFTTFQPTNNWKGTEWLHCVTIPTGEVGSEKKIDEQNVTASVENGLINVFVPYQAPKVTKVKVI